jgi:hypothetical protein
MILRIVLIIAGLALFAPTHIMIDITALGVIVVVITVNYIKH